MFNVCTLRTNWLKILILEDLGWIQVFLKNFSSHTHAFFFIKQCALRSFCIKMLCFSKIWFFQTFDWLNLFFDQSKLRLKFLVWVCLTRLMFDRFSIDRNWKIFSFYVFYQKKFSCIICDYGSHALHCFVSILQFCSHISYYFHSAMFAFYWKIEYFFFMCILNLVLKKKKKKTCLCLFIYPHPLYFSPKLFFPKLVLFFLFL